MVPDLGCKPDYSFLDDYLRAVIIPAPSHVFFRTLHPNIHGPAFTVVMYTPSSANVVLFGTEDRWVTELLARAVFPPNLIS